MKFFKEYKGVMLVYLVMTIINVLFVVNYDRSDTKNYNEVKNNTNIVMSENVNY